jgi:hypothetical protein
MGLLHQQVAVQTDHAAPRIGQQVRRRWAPIATPLPRMQQRHRRCAIELIRVAGNTGMRIGLGHVSAQHLELCVPGVARMAWVVVRPRIVSVARPRPPL